MRGQTKGRLKLSVLMVAAASTLLVTGFARAQDPTDERIESFVLFNEQLKSAVCDDNFLAKAPSLESINDREEEMPAGFEVSLSEAKLSESSLVSFLLGDTGSVIPSRYLAEKLPGAIQPASSPGNAADGGLAALKRKLALEICVGLIDGAKFRLLLSSTPSRFLQAKPMAGIQAVLLGSQAQPAGMTVWLRDPQKRFGAVRQRVGSTRYMRYLVGGWIEPFEVSALGVSSAGSRRIYRRLTHPLTKNLMSIEVLAGGGPIKGMAVGVLVQSREPGPSDWQGHIGAAESTENRGKQVEQVRQWMEFDALSAMEEKPANRKKVRDLHEFYKNLLQAYQLFPEEKQFESYAKKAAKAPKMEELTREVFGTNYLEELARARVNGNSVRLVLFKPDPRLLAIYQEFRGRLGL